MTTVIEPPQLETNLLQPHLQPHRPSTSCDKHPEEQFTGFCPTCLCERLTQLVPQSTASSSRNPPSITTFTAAAALKAIFKPSSITSKPADNTSSQFPELRRSKSFSASKNEAFPSVFEPQRKSCDVRARSTLWSLFTQDDERNPAVNSQRKVDRVGSSMETCEVEPPRVSSSSLPRISTSSLPPPVFEEEGEGEEEEETPKFCPEVPIQDEICNVGFVDPGRTSSARPIEEILEIEEDNPIVIEPEEFLKNLPGVEEVDDLKSMKEHLDHDSHAKKRDFKEIAGSFWSAASVFSKKLQKWRQKQKLKKQRREEMMSSRVGVLSGVNGGKLQATKATGRQIRETLSEVADYGFGRRSCDIDPRYSLDIGRISFEDQPRYSFDEARASWDGYLMAGRLSSSGFTRMPTMAEDFPVNTIANNINGIVNHSNTSNVARSDGQIPVEFDDALPGGTVQTREYYLDTSTKKRRSLDRSSSIRKTAAAVVSEMDELKNACNGNQNPTIDSLLGVKTGDSNSKELKNSSSVMDDYALTLELGCRENGRFAGNGVRRSASKKSWRWGRRWSIWGFIHRRNIKDENDDRYSRSNSLFDRSFSESWQDVSNRKMMRSSSSVSWRSSNVIGNVESFRSTRMNNVEMNGHCKRTKEYAPERNRSARYSPTNGDNGMLRLYLTPMRGSRRVGWGKGKPSHTHSIARSVLRLY